jgi:uncharacterized membrane protein HdeD (DUF308 family)
MIELVESPRDSPRIRVALIAILLAIGLLFLAWLIKSVVVAVFAIFFLLVSGVSMWWEPKASRNWSDLGTSLVSGAVVAVSVLVLQLVFQHKQVQSQNEFSKALALEQEKAAERAQEQRDRQDLLLTLTLSQNLTGINLSGKELPRVYLNNKVLNRARPVGD